MKKEAIMSQSTIQEIRAAGGGALTISAMDEYSRLEIGRKTYDFVRRLMQNPEYKALIQAKVAEMQAASNG